MIFLLFLFLFGCATQASHMDLEGRIEKVEAQLAAGKNVKKVAPSGVPQSPAFGVDLETGAQSIDDLAREVQRLASKVEEITRSIEEVRGSKSPGPPAPPAEEGKLVIPGRPAEPQKRSSGPRRPSGVGLTDAFNAAYNDYLKGEYELSVLGFEDFLEEFPDSALVPQALYWLGESYYAGKQLRQAIAAFDRLVLEHPESEKAAPALFKEASAFAEMGDRGRGRALFKKVVEQFPRSPEAAQAKERLAER